MAVSAVSYRKANGYATADAYQMYIEAYETGNVSGTKRQVHIRLWGYAKNPGGYTESSYPYAYTDYNSRQVRDWWPRDTWIVLVEHYVYVEGGQTYTFGGSYNSNRTTSFMPLIGNWYVSVSLYVNPVFAVSTISSSSVLPAKIYAGQTITYSMNVSSFNPGVNADGRFVFVLRWLNPTENIWVDGGYTSARGTGNRTYTIPSNAAGKTLRTYVEHVHRKSYGAPFSYDATGIQDRVVGSYVQVQNPQVTNITTTGCKLSMGSSNPSDTDRSSYAIYDITKTTKIWPTTSGHKDDTPPAYSVVVTGLQPNTEYYARFDLRTQGSQTWDPRGAQWVKFQTHPNPVQVVNPQVTNITTTGCKLSMNTSDLINTDRSDMFIWLRDRATLIKISPKIRYIKITQAGSTSNASNHIVECMVYNNSGINVALGKTVTNTGGEPDSSRPLTRIVDGAYNNSQLYAELGTGTSVVTIDLGSEMTDIRYCRLWRYYADNRTYYNTSVKGYDASGNLTAVFHDYTVDGTYAETSSGMYLPLYRVIYDDLSPDTEYSAQFRLRTKGSSVWSNIVFVDFKTLEDNFTYIVDDNGVHGPYELYFKENDITNKITKENINVIE